MTIGNNLDLNPLKMRGTPEEQNTSITSYIFVHQICQNFETLFDKVGIGRSVRICEALVNSAFPLPRQMLPEDKIRAVEAIDIYKHDFLCETVAEVISSSGYQGRRKNIREKQLPVII